MLSRISFLRWHSFFRRGFSLLQLFLLRHETVEKKIEDDEKTDATVMSKEATGKEERANQVDVARCSYLEALTRGRG